MMRLRHQTHHCTVFDINQPLQKRKTNKQINKNSQQNKQSTVCVSYAVDAMLPCPEEKKKYLVHYDTAN